MRWDLIVEAGSLRPRGEIKLDRPNVLIKGNVSDVLIDIGPKVKIVKIGGNLSSGTKIVSSNRNGRSSQGRLIVQGALNGAMIQLYTMILEAQRGGGHVHLRQAVGQIDIVPGASYIIEPPVGQPSQHVSLHAWRTAVSDALPIDRWVPLVFPSPGALPTDRAKYLQEVRLRLTRNCKWCQELGNRLRHLTP